MASYAAASQRSVPALSGVRQRVLICLLAAVLALIDRDWLPSTNLQGASGNTSTGVTINGTRIELECGGRGASTIILVGAPVVATVIDDSMQAELARFVRLCTVTVVEGASRHQVPELSSVLTALLVGGNVPGPYVIVSHVTPSTASAWVSGPLAQQVAGFVLINPPQQPTSVIISAHGYQSPLPLNDRDEMVLAILSLFWPPDEE